MIKNLITATSFALGGPGVVLVGYLGTHPRAFTHPVAERPAVALTIAAAADQVAVEPTGNAIVLSELRITAPGKRAHRQPLLPARRDPCSEWSEVGAMFVDPAGATGVRHVRNLCDSPGDER
jgi:hypothetical protein